MSAFSGRYHKGAMRERRADKRIAAEERNKKTDPRKRRAYRLAAKS